MAVTTRKYHHGQKLSSWFIGETYCFEGRKIIRKEIVIHEDFFAPHSDISFPFWLPFAAAKIYSYEAMIRNLIQLNACSFRWKYWSSIFFMRVWDWLCSLWICNGTWTTWNPAKIKGLFPYYAENCLSITEWHCIHCKLIHGSKYGKYRSFYDLIKPIFINFIICHINKYIQFGTDVNCVLC